MNAYNRVIKAGAEAKYSIQDISLEYDKVTDPNLARMIRNQYNGKLVLLYDGIVRHAAGMWDEKDPQWEVKFNSLKGVLILCKERVDGLTRKTEKLYNPKITNVQVTVDGVPSQLYCQGIELYQQWDEIRKHFAGGLKRQPKVGMVVKDLGLSNSNPAKYLTDKYALWLDMRTTDDDQLHGSDRRSDNVIIQIIKKVEATGPLNVYVYVIMDAQLNMIEDGRFVNVLY